MDTPTDRTPEPTPPDSQTGHMLRQLQQETSFSSFVQRNHSAFFHRSVAEQLCLMMEKYGVSKNDVVARCDIERGYGYQILRGTREASRDKLLRLAFGIGMSVEDTQQLLTLANKGPLYPKIKRDAALLFCLGRRYTLLQAVNFLYDMELDPLD